VTELPADLDRTGDTGLAGGRSHPPSDLRVGRTEVFTIDAHREVRPSL
jgi:hypothetical protein